MIEMWMCWRKSGYLIRAVLSLHFTDFEPNKSHCFKVHWIISKKREYRPVISVWHCVCWMEKKIAMQNYIYYKYPLWQVCPLLWYPAWHLQRYFPKVFWHSAFWLQLCVPSLHSSISKRQEKEKIDYLQLTQFSVCIFMHKLMYIKP